MKEKETEKTKENRSIRRQKQEKPYNTAPTRKASDVLPLLRLLGAVPCFISGPQRVIPAGSRHCPVGTDPEGTRCEGHVVLTMLPAPSGAPWPLWHPLLTPAALNPMHLQGCSCHLGTSVNLTQSLVDWGLLAGEAVSTHPEGQYPGLVPRAPKTQTL